MPAVSAIRKTIYKAIGESERKASRTTFAAKKKPPVRGKTKRKGTRGQPNIVGIFEENGKLTDIYGRTYKAVEIDGKRFMKRDDGQLFKERRDGMWQHVIPKRKKGFFR